MEEPQVGNIFSLLSNASSQVFEELAHIGYLTRTYSWGNYDFVIRTLTLEEEIATGQLVKHLNGVIGQEKALVAAIAAVSVVSINGKDPFPENYQIQDPLAVLRDRYKQILERWHWPVIAKFNEEYIKLQEQMYESLREIENLSPEGRSMSLENFTESFVPSNVPTLSEEKTIGSE